MIITIDTSVPLVADDRKVLLALLAVEDQDLDPLPTPEKPKRKLRKPLVAVPDPEPEPVSSMDAAIDQATKLVSEGKREVVEAALAKAGAKRVSELSGDAVDVFLGALNA